MLAVFVSARKTKSERRAVDQNGIAGPHNKCHWEDGDAPARSDGGEALTRSTGSEAILSSAALKVAQQEKRR